MQSLNIILWKKYSVAWENVHNDLLKWNLKTGYKHSIAYTRYTWLVRMAAPFPHEESGTFLEIRGKKQRPSVSYVNLWLSTLIMHILILNNQHFISRKMKSFHFIYPQLLLEMWKFITYMLPPIAEFSLPKWILLAISSKK